MMNTQPHEARIDFNDKAIEAYEWACAEGIIGDETIDELIEIVQDQDIITIANEHGSVIFDYTDLVMV